MTQASQPPRIASRTAAWSTATSTRRASRGCCRLARWPARRRPTPPSTMTATSTSDLPGPHRGGLSDHLPADTFAFLSASDLGDNLGLLVTAVETPVGACGSETQLLKDVGALTNGDLLFYLRPGLPVTGALLLRPNDPARGMQTIARLLRTSTAGSGVRVHGNTLEVAPGIEVSWKRVGDVIAVSNDPAAGTPPEQTLADSGSYQDFLHAAGAPSDASVVLYV